MRIDIVSDVVCPWCAVGYHQLQQAISQTGVGVQIFWHPFELNPGTELIGKKRDEYLKAKYGMSDDQLRQNQQRLRDAGMQAGFTFNFQDSDLVVNTFSAHQLVHWAASQGVVEAVKPALFKAHFSDKRDISDISVLADIAAEQGLDRERATAVLLADTVAEEVRQAEKSWIDRGITGVPAMVFDNRYLSNGAQGSDNYRAIIERCQSEATA